MPTILIYYCTVNAILFLLMLVDKILAKTGQRRIRERTLWFFGFIGGALGGFIAMALFRHKIRKNSFYIYYGLSVILHTLVIYLLCYKL